MDLPLDPAVAGDQHLGTALAFPPSAFVSQPRRYAAGSLLSGKYRLDTLLGEGGMGAVWRASNLLLELPVAIKLIRADLDHGALRARLQLEARSAAKLGHPAIVRVYDVGETEQGDPFIVMELLHGQTVAELLSAEGRLEPVRAVQLALPLIDALAMAHARGIVHRDLKPDNLMIVLEEQRIQPKILDFGVAKLTDRPELDRRLTEVGSVVGSPDYMSPEQARGREDVDASSDIWSMSVVLYECITGVTPFDGPNYNALLRAIVEDSPRPLSAYGIADEHLWSVLARGLAKDRCERYGSIVELGQALAAWLVARGVSEDACGTAVDSKWLGRARAASTDSLPGTTGDLLPIGLGSKASRKGPARATRIVVGVAALACSALLLGKLAMNSGTSTRGAATQLAAVLPPMTPEPAALLANVAIPEIAPHAAPIASAIAEAAPLPPPTPKPMASSKRAFTVRAALSAPPSPAAAPRAEAAPDSAIVSLPAPVKPRARSRDLIAPY